MISVELWRARIGHFNSKRYSGFLSSLFSSYVPFKFRRRRKRSSNVDTDAQQDLEQPSSGAASHQSRPPPPSASNSSGPPSLDESPLVSSLQQSLLFFLVLLLAHLLPSRLTQQLSVTRGSSQAGTADSDHLSGSDYLW